MNNLLGIHVLSFIGQYDEANLRLAVEKTKRHGFGLLEMSIHDTPLDHAFLKGLAEEAGIQLGCSRGLDLDADIANADADIAARGWTILENAILTTAKLGGTYFGGLPYGALAKYTAPPTKAGRDNAVKYMRDGAQLAAEHGITLGLEVVNRYENNLLNTAQQALDFAEDIGEDNVVVHLDTYHMNIEEENFTKPVEICGDKLGYVHVGESHRGYLGTGTIPWDEFFGALKANNYAGPITFESFSSAVVDPDLSNNLCVWRNLWDDSDDLASSAHAFVTKGMQ